MDRQNIWRLAKSDYLKLVPILALAFYIAFIPNLDYSYPVHIDEWVHIAYSNSLLQAADINYLEPFTGQPASGLVSMLEVGFHVLFGVFHKISGMSWIDIVRYFPGIILAVTTLSVYVLARREGFGWEAAFFSCLIPTAVGIMGPAFFVPVAMGFLFVALSLFLVFNYRTFWSYLVLFIFTVFMIIMHATSAVLLILIVFPVIVLYLKSEPRHSLMLILIWAVPFLVTLPWTYDLILSTAQSLLVLQPIPANHDLPHIIKTYGYLPVGLGLLGIFWLALKGGVKNYGLVFGVLVVVVMMAIFFTLHYGVTLVYLRGILYALLMLGIVAGAGLMAIKNLRLPTKLGVPLAVQRIGYPLCLALIVAVLVLGIPTRQNIPYYYMIDKEDYEAFVWIRDNLKDGYEKAILDPWKATPFTALTEKYIYTRTHVAPTTKDKKAADFLRNGCKDTAFLRENGISIIYSLEPCSNPDLLEVRKNVYTLRESTTQ
ncbi:hypothetical protein ACFLVB_02505 [Chloroflexota bacterium]